MKKFAGLMLIMLLAVGAFAGDVSGKWTSKQETPRGTMERTYVFTQSGDTLTGKIVNPRGEVEIKNGKVNGDEISFTVEQRRQDQTVTVTYKGKVSGDKIEGTMNMGERSVPWTATKAKE